MQIEQGIFTSARTTRSAGYQLVAASPGVREADARELSIWGPSHDSLYDDSVDAESANFHHLPSGNYCISKTVFSGDEYSDRGGRRIYTHCLVVPAGVLASFANNPFSVLMAAMVQGSLSAYQDVPLELSAIKLPGRTSAVDVRLLEDLAEESGAVAVAALVRDALKNRQLGLRVDRNAHRWVAALLNCLPVECRTQFSFSTGLKTSARRPFRIVRLADNYPAAVRRIQSKHRMAVWSPELKPSEVTVPFDGWPGLIAALLGRGDVALLAEFLSRPRPGLTLGELEKLGNQLRTNLASSTSRSCAPKPDETLATGSASVPELVQHLRRNPSNVGHWARWVQIHDDALAQHDCDRAAEMVFKACQLFGVHSTPQPQLIRRVETLLETEYNHHESDCIERTIARLQELKPVFGRDRWVQLAERVAQRPHEAHPQERTADLSQADDEQSTEPTVLSFTAEQRDLPSSSRGPDAKTSFERAGGDSGAPAVPAGRGFDAPCCVAAPDRPAHTRNADSDTRRPVELLELLDDTVFAAIAGGAEAAETLDTLWPKVLEQLGNDSIEESRQQYLRHALATWHQCTGGHTESDPDRWKGTRHRARVVALAQRLQSPARS